MIVRFHACSLACLSHSPLYINTTWLAVGWKPLISLIKFKCLVVLSQVDRLAKKVVVEDGNKIGDLIKLKYY